MQAVSPKFLFTCRRVAMVILGVFFAIFGLDSQAKVIEETIAVPVTGQDGLWRTIALDLGADGIQSISKADSKVAFDVDGQGYLKPTAWVGAGDAMLVLDKSSNSLVDEGEAKTLGDQGIQRVDYNRAPELLSPARQRSKYGALGVNDEYQRIVA